MLEIRVYFAEGTSEEFVRTAAQNLQRQPNVDGVDILGLPRATDTPAEAFLKSLFPEFYADGDYWHGPRAVKEIEALGKEHGFSYDRLHEASVALGWNRFKLRGLTSGPNYWHPWLTKDDVYS